MKKKRSKINDDVVGKELLFKEIAISNFNIVKSTASSLDQKIYNIILLCSSLLTIILGFSYFIFKYHVATGSILFFMLVTSILLLISLGIGLISYKPMDFPIINTSDIIKYYSSNDYYSILKTFNDNLALVTDDHTEIINMKAFRLKWMMGLMVLGLLSFALAFINYALFD